MHAISAWASSGGGGGMIERRYRQRNLFEAVLGSVEELVEGLSRRSGGWTKFSPMKHCWMQ